MKDFDMDSIITSRNKSVLCWLATIDQNGYPNVSPKEVFMFYNKLLLIANIASKGSEGNIKQNAKTCVSFVDVFIQKGWKIKGYADIVLSTGADFNTLQAPLTEITKGMYAFSSIFRMSIENVEEIKAPSYFLYPNQSVDEKVINAMKTYKVRPIND